MFNDKEIELSHGLFNQLKEQFPEIALAGITPSAENPQDVWVNLVMPEDEDREIALREIAAEISTEILLDYGYHITIVTADPPHHAVAA